MSRPSVVAALGFVALVAGSSLTGADDGWNPFKEKDQPRRSRQQSAPADQAAPMPAMDGVDTRPWDRPAAEDPRSRPPGFAPSANEQLAPWSQGPATVDRSTSGLIPEDIVQRGELQPVTAAESAGPVTGLSAGAMGSSLPSAAWQGLDMARLPELIAPLSIPPRSAALADMWRRLWSEEALASPASSRSAPGATPAASLAAVRIEALYRSGLIADLQRTIEASPAASTDAVSGLLYARTRLLLGNQDAGCSQVKGLQRAQATLPRAARHDFLLLAALCGAAGRDAGAAGLAADLLRAESVVAPIALAALDAVSLGASEAPKPPAAKRLSLLDYRFLELARAERMPGLVAAAEPALLSVLATSAADAATRVLASEAALSLHSIRPSDLADAYRAASTQPSASAEPSADRLELPLRRAGLFKAFEAERTPQKKTRLARTLLDEIRRARGPYLQAAAMLAPGIEGLQPAPEIGWFAETAIEINLAAGRFDVVRRWAEPPLNERYGSLRHWLVLTDIADSKMRGRRGEDLGSAEQFAVRGRLSPELMHRLVTVLDALDYQIPIPLWEAASRSPQPSSGHLPETGILSQLQEASAKREHARLVLTAMRALGPDSGEIAHMIALGDTIRALKRAGLEGDARRLGLEALFAGWPRAAHN